MRWPVITASQRTLFLFDAATTKVPVHVSVGQGSFEIEGPPFDKCAPKV